MAHSMTAARGSRKGSVPAPRADDAAVRVWLGVVAALVFCMIVVGGATRLTGSGLSITEWKPLLGALPPLSDADWQGAFAKYREILQYHVVNKGMTLAEFKFIYWWEWSHRFLGRFIGLAFALPLLIFWLGGRLRPGLAPKLAGLLLLGGLQGFVGWYMVQSGLVDRIDVSQYRLALHLGIAFAVFGALLWLVFELEPERDEVRLRTETAQQRRTAAVLVGLVFLQVVLGAFVAGLKAGHAYNTWPLMDGGVLPDAILALAPWWHNATENIATVQFNHRMLAYGVAVIALWHGVSVMRSADDERLTRSVVVLALAVVAQVALGVWTLLTAVPLVLGVAHQAGAAVVFAAAIWHAHAMARATRRD